MKEKLKYISKNMKFLRRKNGLVQEEVAHLLGVSRVTYCNYEKNPQRVKIETLQNMADIFECQLVDFFMIGKDTKSDKKKMRVR